MSDKPIALSLKGADRDQNQDFSISGKRGDGAELWIVADGATSAKKSGEFVSTLCRLFHKDWLTRNPFVKSAEISALLKDIHNQIRRDFILSKGSILLLIIDPECEEQHCFYLGDCRLGTIDTGEMYNDISWVTHPHSLTYREVGDNEDKLCNDPGRHMLYHIFNARRFEQPVYLPLRLDLSKPLILASDGFWSHFPSRLPQNLTYEEVAQFLKKSTWSDDCSVLIRVPSARQAT